MAESPRASTHLTKSRYMAGLQCAKRLWLTVHEPMPWEEPASGSLQETGTEIGVLAHQLFPGGVLVDAQPWEHDEAVTRTASLMMDRSVPAIFEAAFEAHGVRVRVDVLERLERGRWGLREVKASGSVKDHHRDDLAVQAYVLGQAGVRVGSIELLHVNKGYVRGADGIDVKGLFTHADMTAKVRTARRAVASRIEEQRAVLRKTRAPAIEPSSHCHEPYPCEYWERCTADKPADWVRYLPRLGARKSDTLEALGIVHVADIPEDFPLTENQARVRDALRSGLAQVSDSLGAALSACGPPATFLDFETVFTAVPLWPGTRPYRHIPFQWSAHIHDGHGIDHRFFLADGNEDPRPAFAESLVETLDGGRTPILVYGDFENRRLGELQEMLARPLSRAIARLRRRLIDLLPIVRAHVYHPDFSFSASLKDVAPALAPDLTYDDLPIVSDGGAASATFTRIAGRTLTEDEDEAELRRALLLYCERDTLALVEVHRALRQLSKNPETGRG